jgi:hypothetical protein
MLALEVFGELDEQRNVSGVIESSVVQLVALDRSAVTITVQMGCDDDVFVRNRGVRAMQRG